MAVPLYFAAFALSSGFRLYDKFFGGDRPDITEGQKTNEIKAIRQTTSGYGRAIPMVFGKGRVGAHVILLPSESFVHVKGDVGDDLKLDWVGYAVGLGLAEGPITGVGAAWRDGSVYDSLTDLRRSESGLFPNVPSADVQFDWTLKTGAIGQAPYVWPDPFPGRSDSSSVSYSESAYSGTAWIAHSLVAHLPSGSIPEVSNLQFEVQGFCVGADGRADPIDVLQLLMTDPRLGGGLSLTDRGHPVSWTLVQSYAQAMGFRVGWAIEQQQSALELIRVLLDAINCSATDSCGRLKLIPYGDTDLSANGATYTANRTPVYTLTDDDIIVTPGQQPIRIERRSEISSPNCVPVEFTDGRFQYSEIVDGKRSASAYEKKTVEAVVMSDVARTLPGGNKKGIVKAPAVSLPCFIDQGPAQVRSRLYAQRSVFVRCRYTLRMSWKGILLEKGDLVRLSSAAMGLSERVCRITGRRRDRSAGEQGEIELIMEDAAPGTYTASKYEIEEGDGSAGVPSSEFPSSVSAPSIFMPPQRAADGRHYVWVAASGAATVGGADVWYSWDQDRYELAGSIGNGDCAMGTLSLPLAVGAPLDATNTLVVTRVAGVLPSVSELDRDDLVTRCWVDHEILAFKDVSATDTTWSITSLRRGCEGTESRAHSAGTEFVRMDEAPVRIAIDDERRGQTLYVKCVSWNLTRTLRQSLDDVTATPFLVPGRYLTGKLPITITWDDFDREDWDIF